MDALVSLALLGRLAALGGIGLLWSGKQQGRHSAECRRRYGARVVRRYKAAPKPQQEAAATSGCDAKRSAQASENAIEKLVADGYHASKVCEQNVGVEITEENLRVGIASANAATGGHRIGSGEKITDGDFFSAGFCVEKLIVAAHLKDSSVKTVVTGIKTADLLLKAMKTAYGMMLLFQAQGGNLHVLGSPDGIILGLKAAKVVYKGVKMSQKALQSRGIKNVGFGGRFKSMTNGMKVSWGALDLMRGSRAIFSEILSGRVAATNWNLILKGYEASKGAVNTVEALSSFKVGFVSAFAKGLLSVKGAVSGIGVMIKACVVSRELGVFLIKGLGLSHGAREVLKIIAEGREDSKLLALTNMYKNSRRYVKFKRDVITRSCNAVTGSLLSVSHSPPNIHSHSAVVAPLMLYLSAWYADSRWLDPPEAVLFTVQGLQSSCPS